MFPSSISGIGLEWMWSFEACRLDMPDDRTPNGNKDNKDDIVFLKNN